MDSTEPTPERERPSGEDARDRARRIRWKAVAGCLVCFALLWGAITIRMGAGGGELGEGAPPGGGEFQPPSGSGSSEQLEPLRSRQS